MQAFIIFFLLVILVLLIIVLAKVGGRRTEANEMRNDLQHLNHLLIELSKKISLLQNRQEAMQEKKPLPEPPKPPVIKQEVVKPPVIIEPEKPKPIIKEEMEETLGERIKKAEAVTHVQIEKVIVPAQPVEPLEPEESWFEKWLRNNPDIEKFIGENLINKIGIAILVLGIGFFVKYAIDQQWINEYGRTGIGLLCGIILISIAHRLRQHYRSFSSVLVGGGLTVFYFTIALAFHQYHIIKQPAAFIIMLVITAFAVVLAILYDRIELAIIATIGGFITPFLVSTGAGNYIVLFTYLGILNAGLIVLAFYKRWHLLHFIALGFTVIIYGGVCSSPIHKTLIQCGSYAVYIIGYNTHGL